MTREISPHFQDLPDQTAAEAFSEVLTRLPEMKVESMDMRPGDALPPEPAYLTAICAAYIENEGGQERLRRQASIVESGGHQAPVIARNFLNGFKRHITPYHEMSDAIFSDEDSLLNAEMLAANAVEKAKAAKLKTVAAFVLFSASGGDRHYTGLIIPKKTFTEVPLEGRQLWTEILRDFKTKNIDLLKLYDPQTREGVQRVLQNDPRSATFATATAAFNLPRVEHVEAALSSRFESNANNDKYAGLSRKERRKLQHQERRQQRR